MIRLRDALGRAVAIADPSKSAWRKRSRKLRGDHCEAPGGRHHWELHLHHKDGDWRNFDSANLETLCRSHHLKAHGKRTRRQAGWAHRRGAA